MTHDSIHHLTFQCLILLIHIKMGLLPGFKDAKATLTLIPGATFRDQWLDLKVENSRCVFTKGIKTLHIPMANSEGRLFIADMSGYDAAQQVVVVMKALIEQVAPAAASDDDFWRQYQHAFLTDRKAGAS